jgi:hypothetical protein
VQTQAHAAPHSYEYLKLPLSVSVVPRAPFCIRSTTFCVASLLPTFLYIILPIHMALSVFHSQQFLAFQDENNWPVSQLSYLSHSLIYLPLHLLNLRQNK